MQLSSEAYSYKRIQKNIISCVNYIMLGAFPLPSILPAVNVLLRVRDSSF